MGKVEETAERLREDADAFERCPYSPEGDRLLASVGALLAALDEQPELPEFVKQWAAQPFKERCLQILSPRGSKTEATSLAWAVLEWAKRLATAPAREVAAVLVSDADEAADLREWASKPQEDGERWSATTARAHMTLADAEIRTPGAAAVLAAEGDVEALRRQADRERAPMGTWTNALDRARIIPLRRIADVEERCRAAADELWEMGVTLAAVDALYARARELRALLKGGGDGS